MPTQPRPRIGLLILDLDDTVWTWFDAWHESFTAMLTEVKKKTKLSDAKLIPAIKAVHERKGTAEYSWLLDELPLLDPWLKAKGKKASEVFDQALHAQNSARKYNTHLYPGVAETLNFAKSNGVKIVAYTESLAFWTEWRLRLTGLDGVIDVLYSSPDHDFPDGETVETVRTLPAEAYGMKATIHRHVARGISKPDPQILREIIDRHAVAGLGTAYVGDSLDRDVEMAQSVPGVYDVHAKYGEKHHLPEYKLIQDVTHWPSDQVAKEQSKDSKVKAKPKYVLSHGFYELLTLFDFGSPFDAEAHITLWKEAVGVQMHFNDIGWRIRALALTVLTFTLGAIGFVYVNTEPAKLGDWEFSPALLLPVFGFGLWCAFWFADRGWFHKLLIGSVQEGTDQERILTAHGIPTNLGGYISAQSPIKFMKALSRRERAAGMDKKDRKPRTFRGKPLQVRSSEKLNWFYSIGPILLVFTFVAILGYGPHRSPEPAPAPSPPIVNNNITIEPQPAPSNAP